MYYIQCGGMKDVSGVSGGIDLKQKKCSPINQMWPQVRFSMMTSVSYLYTLLDYDLRWIVSFNLVAFKVEENVSSGP